MVSAEVSLENEDPKDKQAEVSAESKDQVDGVFARDVEMSEMPAGHDVAEERKAHDLCFKQDSPIKKMFQHLLFYRTPKQI